MTKERNTILIVLIALCVLCPAKSMAQNSPPVANAGSSRYAAQDPIVLDGTGSFDPDDSGLLSYTWRQIAGPSVVIIDANTATPMIGGSIQPGEGRDPVPTISGFTQTDVIQECEFELVVSDGELTSLLDTVKVIIVPDFGADTLQQENPPFDRNKPTLIYFGGGDCIIGLAQYSASPFNHPGWLSRANLVTFPNGYSPDSGGVPRTYYKYGDMIIVYLSSVAPDYKQPIQTSGWSTGGQPAIDVGRYLNLTYGDRRYAINRVTFFDATPFCRDYSESIAAFLDSSVDGEQCWADAYVTTTERPGWAANPPFYEANYPPFYENVLNVWFPTATGSWEERHRLSYEWYRNSLMLADLNNFNHGVVAGAYWSVIGAGKNLQLAWTPDEQTYKLQWYGDASSGYMDFYDETSYPVRLPEPVTILAYSDALDPNGVVLTCKESENAVGYQLLFGPDPYRVMDYNIISDTLTPPSKVITTLPFEETWWTVRVRDQYGSTIYANPIYINAFILSLPIENLTTGKRYAYIQDAINEAYPGDEIVVSEGIYQENINFGGKNLTVRATNPEDPVVVAATVIKGSSEDSAVTFSNAEDANCVLAGFTITDANNGIYCSGASPAITNCSISANVSAGIKLCQGSNPTITNCCIAANGGSGIEMLVYKSGRVTIFNYPIITNCTIAGNQQNGISGGIPTITNSIIWANSPQQIADTKGTFSATYSNVQGGWPGEGNIDADPLFADPDNGDYHLKSQAGRWELGSQSWIIDDVTSPCIDAGDPSIPIGFEPLPNGGIINIGAYGGTAEASKSPEN